MRASCFVPHDCTQLDASCDLAVLSLTSRLNRISSNCSNVAGRLSAQIALLVCFRPSLHISNTFSVNYTISSVSRLPDYHALHISTWLRTTAIPVRIRHRYLIFYSSLLSKPMLVSCATATVACPSARDGGSTNHCPARGAFRSLFVAASGSLNDYQTSQPTKLAYPFDA